MARTHGNRVVLEFFRQLERMGFTVMRKKNGGYVISPPSDNPCQAKYHTHGTPKGMVPMKKELAKMYGVTITD